MSRPIVPLHNISQWLALAPEMQSIILKALKVKDRLWAFRLAQEQEHSVNHTMTPTWVPCRRCDQRGWVLHKPRKHGIHPSAMASQCLLKIFFEAIGIERQVVHEANLLFVFDLGTAAHEMLQRMGQKGAWGPHYVPEVAIGETQVAQELMIEGHCDADNILIVEEIAGAPIFEVGIIHEYKTINAKGYSGLMNSPKPAHKQQATVYSACLDRPVVVYLYLNKDNSNIQDFPVVFDPVLWENMRHKAEVVRDAVYAQVPPQASVGFHCNQCGYAYQCEAYQAAQAARKKG